MPSIPSLATTPLAEADSAAALPLSHDRRPTRAVVDLAALRHNIAWLRRRIGPDRALIAVVKADAYGHGMLPVARVLGRPAAEGGTDMLGVATPDEGLTLRETAGLEKARILVMGPTQADDAEALQAAGLDVAIGNDEVLDAHLALARRRGQPARLHVKVDTGMGRYGLDAARRDWLARFHGPTGASLVGLMTHFSVSDETDHDAVAYTHDQLARFGAVAQALASMGLRPLRHAANSGGVLFHESSWLDAVRPGVILHGLHPDPAGTLPRDENGAGPRPALTLVSRVISLHDHAAGDAISYGRRYIMPRAGRVALVPIGYGDGYPRRLGGVFQVLVRGRRVPVVGRVCMDQTLLDVSEFPDIALGDEVVLYGAQGGERITVEEAAVAAGTISYELTCQIGRRVPRVYVGGE